jgi:hypothetical protein
MAYGASTQSFGANDLAFESLLDSLVGVDASNVNDITSENPEIYNLLRRLTYGATFCMLSANARAQRESSVRGTFEFIMAWLFRLLNSKCWVLPIVLLSLWAWRSNVPRTILETPQSMKIPLELKKTTIMIASDLGNRALSYPQIGSRKL